MKIKVDRVEPKEQLSASGMRKYYVYTGDGDRHIAWVDWVKDTAGKTLEVSVKENKFRGNEYTVIWPTKEAAGAEPAIPSEIAIRSRIKAMAELSSFTRAPEDKEPAGGRKLSQDYWERRDRMMAKESALKSASEVWSTRLSINPTEGGKTDPLQLAREFYAWIMGD